MFSISLKTRPLVTLQTDLMWAQDHYTMPTSQHVLSHHLSGEGELFTYDLSYISCSLSLAADYTVAIYY